jgi:nucleoside-diphosphate-sugar epimerase
MRYSRFRDRRVRRHWGGIGAEPVIADALDAAAVKAAVARIRPDAVIDELTSLPRRYTSAEMGAASERHREVRVEGNINLLAALRDVGVRRYLLQSSGFWYEPGGACGRGNPVRPPDG